MTDLDLDALLSAARDAGPVPSDALMARVMADAVALQPPPLVRSMAKPVPLPVRANAPSRWLDRLAALLGGGGALAGVSLAMVAGVFIGIVQPAPVAALTSALLAQTQFDSVDLFPADTAVWEEPQND